MKTNWYYQIMGETFGPIDRDTLFALGAQNEIDHDTFVRKEGEEWVTADHIAGLLNLKIPGTHDRQRQKRLGEIVGHRDPNYFKRTNR